MLSIFSAKKVLKSENKEPESQWSFRRWPQRLKSDRGNLGTTTDQGGAPSNNEAASDQPKAPAERSKGPTEVAVHQQPFLVKDENDDAGYEDTADYQTGSGQPDVVQQQPAEPSRTEAENGQDTQPAITLERVLAVIVHRTDRIKSKTYIVHPMVKVHVIDANSGEYARKSQWQRAVAYVNETLPARVDALDYILPLMTRPSEFRAQDLAAPTWEELLLFNDEFDHFVDPTNHIMLMFEILDFKSMSAAKRAAQATRQNANQTTDAPGGDERSGGWHRIAWAFLKLVSSNGALNMGKHLRLQLYKTPATTRLRDERQPEVYHWWKYLPRVKYAGTLFVTVKSVDCPRNIPPSSRSMYAVQKESVNGGLLSQHPSSASLHEDGLQTGQTDREKEEEKEEPQDAWSRLPGQPCKVPNKLWLTLSSGRGGCFRLKFSANGKYLAGAGAELQMNKFPIYVYGFPGGKYSGTLYGHVQLVYELFWNSTDLLLSASADCTVRLWNVAYMRRASILTHTTFVYCARFHPEDDNLVFTGAFDKRIRLWSLKSDHKKPQIIQEFEPHSNYVNCLCFTAHKSVLYSGDGAGTVRVWAPADDAGESWMFLKELREDRLMGNPINALEIHPDQKRLFIQSRDGCVRSLELRSLALRAHYRGLRNADTHVRGDLTPCGSLYFAGDGDGRVIVWNVQSALKYAEYTELSLAQCPVTCVSYHPFDHWVAFAIYGPRQPILVYKHDSSAPELHKVETPEKRIEKKQGPSFDPDYSLAKLLEEHRLLTKVDLPTGKLYSGGRKAVAVTKSMVPAGVELSKKVPQVSDNASAKRVTFDDVTVQKQITPIQRRRALFAQRDQSQQSILMEIPLEQAMSQRDSAEADDHAPILESVEAAVRGVPKQPQIIAPAHQQPEAVLAPLASSKAAVQQPLIETVVVSAEAVIGQVRARYSYKAQNDDEISFQKGDVIKVVKKDELWWVGYVDPQAIGYFPANYVTEIEQTS